MVFICNDVSERLLECAHSNGVRIRMLMEFMALVAQFNFYINYLYIYLLIIKYNIFFTSSISFRAKHRFLLINFT